MTFSQERTVSPSQSSASQSIAELAIAARVQIWIEAENGVEWFKFKYRSECWSPPMREDEAREYLKAETQEESEREVGVTTGKELRRYMDTLDRNSPLIEAVLAVASLLEVPRDRLGRLSPSATDESRAAREAVRVLAVDYGVASGSDYMSQCAAVLRAALKRRASL